MNRAEETYAALRTMLRAALQGALAATADGFPSSAATSGGFAECVSGSASGSISGSGSPSASASSSGWLAGCASGSASEASAGSECPSASTSPSVGFAGSASASEVSPAHAASAGGRLAAAAPSAPASAVPLLTAGGWRRLHRLAYRQSLVGVLFPEVRRAEGVPLDVLMTWMAEAEAVRSLGAQQNAEAARLTALFDAQGRRTAVLKGQANARLYPDPLSRQPGDIDLWVEGGHDSVVALLQEMGLPLAEEPAHGMVSAHHVELSAEASGVSVEVHFRPSSGNYNPASGLRMLQWLEGELHHTERVREGFSVPTHRFALVMQLAHIQRHFFTSGIGLRQLCDYALLLSASTPADRAEVARQLSPFGLRHAAGAVMWLLADMLGLAPGLMLCPPDAARGALMQREVMAGGNFGHFAERQRRGTVRRFAASRWRRLCLLRFDVTEAVWAEIVYWQRIFSSLPQRIRHRSLSLRDV